MSTLTPNFGLTQWIGGPPGVGDPISRAELNANFLAIDTLAHAVVCTSATRPGSPYAGQVIYETDTRLAYIRNTANTAWLLIGGIPSVSSTATVLSPYTGQVVFVTTGNTFMRYTGSAWTTQSMFTHSGTATVSTQESTTSTSYVDLATSGPSVTLTSVGTTALVMFGCMNFGSTTAILSRAMSVSVSGATTVAASNAFAQIDTDANGNGQLGTRGNGWVQLTITPGTNTFKAQYRVGPAGTSCTFGDRRIWVYAP